MLLSGLEEVVSGVSAERERERECKREGEGVTHWLRTCSEFMSLLLPTLFNINEMRKINLPV